MTADDALRTFMLRELAGDYQSLGHIDSILAYDFPSEPVTARLARLLGTIHSMLIDGHLLVGGISGGQDAVVVPWSESIEATMQGLRERYVVHHDDPDKWVWTTWFSLTKAGEQAAMELGS